MGADLIVHILTGPKQISDRRIVDATRYLEWIMRELRRIQVDTDWDADSIIGNHEIARILRQFRPKTTTKNFWLEIENYIENLVPLSDDHIDSIVKNFIHMWTEGSARDVSSRDTDANHQIWVCGGSSSGESPSDFYDDVSLLQIYGALEVLGIE